MEIKILGCSGGRTPDHELTSYLIDDSLLIDTGSAASTMSLELQENLNNIFITHAHLDHIIGIAHIYDNTRNLRVHPLHVYGTEPVLRNIREHLLVPSIMPNYNPKDKGEPGINFHPIALEIPFRIGNFEVEAYPVNHTPGAVAVRVSDGLHNFMFTGDTGRTDRIWNWIKRKGMVDCLIAEVSFPNKMHELAEVSAHLTCQSLIESLVKAEIPGDAKVHVVHLKPAFMDELLEEIEGEEDWNLIALKKGDVIRLDPGKKEPRILQEEIEEKVTDKIPEFDKASDLYEQREKMSNEFGVSAAKGDVIFQQGDTSTIMYIIQEGKVRIVRKAFRYEKTLAVLGQGDFFGEMAMLNNRPRSATAVAMTDVKLLAFDRKAFESLILDNFGVALRIIRTLSNRLQDADGLIENLLYVDPESKIINTLIKAAYDEGIETSEGFVIRTTPEELSDRSGVIIETLRDILTDLVKNKMILARRETLIIPDPQKLKRLMKFLELKDEFLTA